jgi:hypothetical protein
VADVKGLRGVHKINGIQKNNRPSEIPFSARPALASSQDFEDKGPR